MNEDNKKKKVRKRLSLKIASNMFPIHSKGKSEKFRHRWKKSSSLSTLRKGKTGSKVELSEKKTIHSPKHAVKIKVGRSLSQRFQSFRKWKAFGVEEKSALKNDTNKEMDINVENIGLRKQFSRNLRRTMVRKYKSASDFRSSRHKSSVKHSQSANKSVSDSRLCGPNKQYVSVNFSCRDMSIQLKSRLNSAAESVDLSSIVKPVARVQQIKHPEVPVTPLRKSEFHENVICHSQTAYLDSPTMADPFGVDEEDHYFVFESKSIRRVSIQKPEGNDKFVNDSKDIVSIAKTCQDIKHSDDTEKEDENPLQRRSIVSGDLTGNEHVFDNPWIRKEDVIDHNGQSSCIEQNSQTWNFLTPQISVNSMSGYNSFGFDVRHLVDSEVEMGGMKRSESMASLDSFGSSVHSVQSQELMFSDSEAENDIDRISVSSIDSGTSGNRFLEKSFDSDIMQGHMADKSFSSSENKENIQVKPKVRSRRKHGIAMDDGTDLAGKIARKLFGQQVSVETAIETRESLENPKTELTKRRSLDSNLKIKQMTLELDPESKLKMTGSSDSGLSSVLSPVFETGSHSSSERSSHDKDDVKKYYTLPNPRKSKAGRDSPKKRVSLGTLSKKISEKAHSISNIKLGSSFKLRNIDKEATKLQTFLKTNSWTNLMVKKGAEVASNFSTLMRKRSNSNTTVKSPFMPRSRQEKKNEVEDNELVYEEVRLYAPKKRPATSEDITKWKKRLKLTMEIVHNRDVISGIRSRTNSCLGRGNSSNSLSPIFSPTLLDELMKSVDRVRFDGYTGSVITDLDQSDDEEDSSSSGSPPVFCNKHRPAPETAPVKSEFLFLCKTCGKIKNHTNSLKDLSGGKKQNLTKHENYSKSLCDLHGFCNCLKDSFQNRFINGLSPDMYSNRGSLEMLQENTLSESGSCLDIMCNKLKNNKTKRPMSMLELRHIEKVLFDEDAINKQSGVLHRPKPVLNLSDDNLDKGTEETETMDDQGTCQSCEDLISVGKSSMRGGYTSDNLLSPGNQFEDVTPEIYHSCSEVMEPETCEIGTDETDYKKSQSCGNLVDEAEVFIDNKLKHDNDLQYRKELRKAKVKSLSSSHDALSSFVAMENLEVAKDIEGVVKDLEKNFGEKVNLNDDEKESPDTINERKDTNKTLDATNSGKDENETSDTGSCKNCLGSEKRQKTEGACKTCDDDINKTDSCKKCGDITEKHDSCAICEKLRKQTVNEKNIVPKNRKQTSDGLQVSDSKTLHRDLGKPPLPKKERERKVLSMNDIIYQDIITTQISKTQKRHSVNAELPLSSSFSSLSQASTDSNIGLLRKVSCSAPNTPLNDSLHHRTFNFNEKHDQGYTKDTLCPPRLERLKSASSDNMNTMKKSQMHHEQLWSGTLRHTCSEDVFRKTSCHSVPGSPGILDHGGPEIKFSEFFPSSLFPEVPGPDMETVLKYDVGLGYLLHSVQCDNQLICFYSFQRNKQLMESVITPLAALPGVTGTKPLESSNVNKSQKHQNKLKYDNHPNPAAPITAIPSEKLTHAGRVIRTVLLTRASHMIRDRKFHLRTYRRCMVGTEMVDWLIQQSPLVHSRTQATGMWQALLEEGIVVHVCHEHQFKDEYLFYRFHEDDEGVSTVPTPGTKRECEEELHDVFLMLAQTGPDAMMRMILRKLPHERTMEDLEIIYEELLHIKALSHLSTMVKRELASVLVFESHAKSGTVLFNQGDEGKSWYIILKGSVNVVIYGKGVVCTLHEGDDFGKLALVNDAPRAATIVLRDDNCHFLRVDKDDFNRILRDVEANTVRLKEHGQDVLVLEKIPSNSQSSDGIVHTHYKYSVMAGTPEKMLEYLLETRLDSKKEDEIDGFLEDFLLTHVIFMPNNHLCPVLLSHYHSSMADTNESEAYEISLNHKKCVLYFVKEWANTVGSAFKTDQTINAFLEELHSCILEDMSVYSTLKDDVVAMETILQNTNSPDAKSKRKMPTNFTLSRKHSKESQIDAVTKCKPIKPSDETIFKVYCADHTYSTLKLPMDTTVERLLTSTKEKLGLGDDLVLCEVKSTGERIMFKENDLCVISGLSINGRLFITPKEHLDALTPIPEQEGPQEGTFSTVEMISSRELAFSMTTHDWELFACVQEYELIYQVFGRYKFGKITANLDLFLRRFNEIQFWVVTEMVLTTNLSKRVSLLRKFIKIASHCKEFQNLNSFFAIVMGLSNIAVSRLSQTWEKLPGKFKKLFAEFETLMDPSRNHRVYRLSVAKMVPPIIPFMPLLMKDMTFTHEGNKTYFDGLVNFEKMHMIAQTLKTVRFCRSANLDLDVPGSLKSSEAASYIRNLKVIDNQRLLTKLSHKVEPRKT